MREITIQIIKNPNAPLASFSQELHELAINALSIKSGISCAIFALRLASLIVEKELLLESANTEGIVENEKQELILWQVRPNVSAITSDLGKNSEAPSSRLSLAKSDDISDLQAVDEAIKQTSEEQQKRHFYSICLKRKLLVPKRHPVGALYSRELITGRDLKSRYLGLNRNENESPVGDSFGHLRHRKFVGSILNTWLGSLAVGLKCCRKLLPVPSMLVQRYLQGTACHIVRIQGITMCRAVQRGSSAQ
jgi:hypothetical protein